MLRRSDSSPLAQMPGAAEPVSSYLRVRDVLRITGLARSTLYA